VEKYLAVILILLFVLLGVNINAAPDVTNQLEDTLMTKSISSELPQNKMLVESYKQNSFKPDPVKVVWMGAIIPGYGQILNRKYWKLPLVYGGFLGFAYAISLNSTRYSTYLTAYRDIIDKDPTTNSFVAIIPKGYTIDNYGGVSGYTTILKSAQDNYRRNRDLSIIMTIGYYALTIVDAYVDAQLYDFDISPDLSMRLQPVLLTNNKGFSNTLGIQCKFNMK